MGDPTVQPGAIIEPGSTFGDNVVIGYNTIVESDCNIGNNVRIFHLCNITKGCTIEDRVFIGPCVCLTNTRHISHGRNMSVTGKWEPPIIKFGARLGGGCRVLAGVTIGEESLIAMGANVTKNTEPYGIYMGNPARKVGEVPVNMRLRK